MLSQYMVTAAFCKCGFFSNAECHKPFGVQADLIEEGADKLDRAQKELMALHIQQKTWFPHVSALPAAASVRLRCFDRGSKKCVSLNQ